MKKNKAKKLSLKKETIQQLAEDDLKFVVGGEGGETDNGCGSCPNLEVLD